MANVVCRLSLDRKRRDLLVKIINEKIDYINNHLCNNAFNGVRDTMFESGMRFDKRLLEDLKKRLLDELDPDVEHLQVLDI